MYIKPKWSAARHFGFETNRKGGNHMAKRKSIAQQMKQEIYKQAKEGIGRSRHEDKRNGEAYNKIYSERSMRTHLSRAEQFGNWMKREHPQIRQLRDITPEIAKQYVNHQLDRDRSVQTIKADLTMLNKIMVNQGHWSERLTRTDLQIATREDPRNNNQARTAEQRALDEKLNAKYARAIEYGQAFGLRRSELSYDRSRQTTAGTKSLYEHQGKLYHVTTGKGGRLRAIECLKTHEKAIREQYGQHIQPMPEYLQKGIDGTYTKHEIERFKEEHKESEAFFEKLDRDLRVHVECRQFYAEHKLEEIQEERRFSQVDELRVNDVTLTREEGNFISHQLGHGNDRLDVLSSYLGR